MDQREWETLRAESEISDLGFSVRTQNALLNAGVTTLEKLASMSDYDLINLNCLGRRSLCEIRGKVPPPGRDDFEVQLRQTMNKLCDILIDMRRGRS
jgi:DNA-directed RNA polymerase alpha subunit